MLFCERTMRHIREKEAALKTNIKRSVHKSPERNAWTHWQSYPTSNKCSLYCGTFLGVTLDNLIILSSTLMHSMFCIGIWGYWVAHTHFANSIFAKPNVTLAFMAPWSASHCNLSKIYPYTDISYANTNTEVCVSRARTVGNTRPFSHLKQYAIAHLSMSGGNVECRMSGVELRVSTRLIAL